LNLIRHPVSSIQHPVSTSINLNQENLFKQRRWYCLSNQKQEVRSKYGQDDDSPNQTNI